MNLYKIYEFSLTNNFPYDRWSATLKLAAKWKEQERMDLLVPKLTPAGHILLFQSKPMVRCEIVPSVIDFSA